VGLSWGGSEGGGRGRGSGRSDETLERFYFIGCSFDVSVRGLDDLESKVPIHSGVGIGSVNVRETDRLDPLVIFRQPDG
jgi:hypothetical protein